LTVVRDPKGGRLGDRIALTQVVDGFGAREFVKILRDQLTVEALRSGRNTKPFDEPVHPAGHSTTRALTPLRLDQLLPASSICELQEAASRL